MIASLILALIGAQAEFPTLPPGVHPVVANEFRLANVALHEGKAPNLAGLPDRNLHVEFDSAALPVERRAEAKTAVTDAVAQWARQAEAKVASQGPVDVRVVMVDREDARTAATRRVGALVVLELNVRRGSPAQFIPPASVFNETLRAIGLSLGVAESPTFGTAMGRSDLVVTRRSGVSPRESFVARTVLEAADRVRELSRTKAKPEIATPEFMLQAGKVEGAVTQGEIVRKTFRVRNTGSGMLRLVATPDCSCIRVTSELDIPPGAMDDLEVQVDTTEYTGEFRHRVFVWTNAPGRAFATIPVEVDIAPRWLLAPTEAPVVLVQDGQATTVDFFFGGYGESHPKPTSVNIEGFEGSVSIDEMPAPGNLFPSPPQKVWRLRASLDPGTRNGRIAGNITVVTDDPRYTMIRRSFHVQRGIAVLPGTVSFGEAIGARDGQVLIGRPGKAFKILKVTSDSPHVTAQVAPAEGAWDYRILVSYDGKAKGSELLAVLTVETDDPAQPQIKIPVQAILPPSSSLGDR